MMKKRVSAAVMSLVLAAAMSMSVFADDSSTSMNTNITGGSGSSDTNTQPSVTPVETVPEQKPAAPSTIVPADATPQEKQDVATAILNSLGDGAGQLNEDSSTAMAIASTDGSEYYVKDPATGLAKQTSQSDITLHASEDKALTDAEEEAAENDPDYVGKMRFTLTDGAGNTATGIYTEGSLGSSAQFNTRQLFKTFARIFTGLGKTVSGYTGAYSKIDASRLPGSYEEFVANAYKFKFKSVVGGRLVDTDLVRWVQGEDGMPYLAVNYQAFNSQSFVIIYEDNAAYGSTTDAVTANVTGTVTNPTMSPVL